MKHVLDMELDFITDVSPLELALKIEQVVRWGTNWNIYVETQSKKSQH